MDSFRAGGGRPIVLIVDDFGWEGFYQIAAALRREGVKPVRVRVGAGPILPSPRASIRAVADRLLYEETIVLGARTGRARLERLLGGGAVADVIANEPTLLKLGLDTCLTRRLAAQGLAYRATPPAILFDKFEVGRRLAAAGVPTPRQATVEELTPREAARAFGLPILVKDRIGAGGDGVRVASSLPAIERAIEALGDRSRLFYEERIEGDVLLYASVTGPQGRLASHGFRVERVQYPLGPATVVRLADEADLLAAGQRVTEVFGSWGFADLGFIRARDGRLYHFDANFRFAGYMIAPLPFALDLIGPYVAMIRGRPWARSASRPPEDRELSVHPVSLLEAAARGPTFDFRTQAGTFLKHYLPILGPRYLAYLAVALAGALAFRARSWMAAAGRPRLRNQFS